jgi:hydroxyacylglutathione hydrolase
MLSGDFLFVGSLGRPDLLGEEVKQELARTLFRSVRERLADLPDGIEVHPGHGAGSMCGSGMSGRPMSTLGFERRANPYLDPGLTEDEFVEKILGSAPPFPPYYLRMKEVNAAGPPILDGLPGLDPVDVDDFARAIDAGAVVVDLRDFLAYGGAHVPGSFGIGIGGSLSAWAAWVVPYETPILLVAPDPRAVEPAVRALVRVGLDDVRGWLQGGIESWRESGRELASVPQMDVTDLHQRLSRGEGPVVLDVRGDGEWESGHIEGAIHIHGGQVAERLDEIPADGRGVVVLCGGGYRSTVASSVLKRGGFEDVRNVPGGMGAWMRLGLPVVRE